MTWSEGLDSTQCYLNVLVALLRYFEPKNLKYVFKRDRSYAVYGADERGYWNVAFLCFL